MERFLGRVPAPYPPPLHDTARTQTYILILMNFLDDIKLVAIDNILEE